MLDKLVSQILPMISDLQLFEKQEKITSPKNSGRTTGVGSEFQQQQVDPYLIADIKGG